MSDQDQERADLLLQEALEATGARDPREFYRARLKELKLEDPAAYDRAVDHFREVLVPSIARDGADPLLAWTEYGRTLAELSAPGRTMAIDPTGKAEPWEPAPPGDRLVLHLPDARNRRALLVGLPPDLSTAQRATYDWLVAGRQTLR